MGRKRRKIIKKQARPYPKVYLCPLCNTQAVTVTVERRNIAVVKCGNCGVSHEVPWYRSYMPVDAYSVWYDVVTGRRSPEDLRREIEKMAMIVEEAEELIEEESESQPQEPVETAEETEDTVQNPEKQSSEG